jgi:hypothetical protein
MTTLASASWTERTSADLASLMVELGRVLKSAAFYGYEDPATTALVDRAHRAWQSDIARAGPLELTVAADSVTADELPERIRIDHLPELSRAFGSGRIERLRIGGPLSRASFLGLVLAIDTTMRNQARSTSLRASWSAPFWAPPLRSSPPRRPARRRAAGWSRPFRAPGTMPATAGRI